MAAASGTGRAARSLVGEQVGRVNGSEWRASPIGETRRQRKRGGRRRVACICRVGALIMSRINCGLRQVGSVVDSNLGHAPPLSKLTNMMKTNPNSTSGRVAAAYLSCTRGSAL
jgi:hypothetical protein